MVLAGAKQFAQGGYVSSLGDAAAGAFGRMVSRITDDVPAVLQTGEGVLSRRGMRALGGNAALNKLNAGVPTDGGPSSVNVTFDARGSGLSRAAAALLPFLIGGVTAEVNTPGTQLRSAVMTGSSPMPYGTRATPRKKA